MEGDGVPAKKAKSLCKYLPKWEEAYPYLTRSDVGQSHAFCELCRTDFSVTHGGKNDVSQHDKSAKHRRAQAAQKHAAAPFRIRTVSEADQVTKAELKMSMLCAKNNVAFGFCDDFNRSVADMFPDSAIARKYSAGKRKATQLIKGLDNFCAMKVNNSASNRYEGNAQVHFQKMLVKQQPYQRQSTP